jgi:hypothetical protein
VTASLRRTARLRTLLLMLLFALAAGAARAEHLPQRVDVILSQLPAAGSAAYAEIKRQAGRARGQRLPLSKAEMWSVSRPRLAALERAARAHGAGITVLGTDWNEVFRPPSPPTQLTPEQQVMLQRARAASGTQRVAVVVAPPAAVVEYALTQQLVDGRSGGGAKIVVTLAEELRLTLTRSSLEIRPDLCVWRGAAEGSAMPATIMWWPAGKLAGVIRYQGHIYSIRHMGGAMHAVIETSEDVLPQDHGPPRR